MSLSNAELFGLFNKAAEDTRWINSATDEEYMSIVTYIYARNEKEAR